MSTLAVVLLPSPADPEDKGSRVPHRNGPENKRRRHRKTRADRNALILHRVPPLEESTANPVLAPVHGFSLTTDIKVDFRDPQSPWQRGSNENTNGLLRQYFPKEMDLSNVHQKRLNAVARRLNKRPRETLGFETLAERFNQCAASIG